MHLEKTLIRDLSGDTLLYAGDLKVRITDWFFIKKKVELKYIGLEDAVIKFQRTDSVWSQQFLFDYFSPSSSSEPKQEKGGMALNLKKAELKNVYFYKKDAWLGENMLVRLGSLNLDAKEIDLAGNKADINSLFINDPYVHLSSYPRLKPAIAGKEEKTDNKVLDETEAAASDSTLQWNGAGWRVQVSKMRIKNGTFRTDKKTERETFAYFDGQHLEFDNIQGKFDNIRWLKDTISTRMSLSAKERSGFEVKKMLADAKVTPTEMAFANLDIETNNSTIRNFFRMSYESFNSMGDFIHQVNMQGEFDQAEIDSDDIAFFAPALSTWKKRIVLNGRIRGTVDDLVGRDLLVQAGNNTLLNGDITLTGLPDIDETFIDFKANDFRTTYGDALTIVPALRKVTSPDLKKIQYIRFNGSFTGFVRDFVTFGTIQTNLGVIKSDLNMKLPLGQQPVYSGNIVTDNFRLGEFIREPQVGALSMEAEIKGRGLEDRYRNANIKGRIRFIDFNDYRYHNIGINGDLNKKLFDGFLSAQDENAELTLNGKIDFNDETPAFNFNADIKKLCLLPLNITENDISFTGKLNADLIGATIDDFSGTASVYEGTLLHNGERLPFDSLTISSFYTDNEKKLSVSSNEFEGNITGSFSIIDLPESFQLFLSKYYPAYIKAPKKIPANQVFSFEITTQFVEDYVRLADSSLSGFNYSHINGSLDTRNNLLNLQANIPQFKYGRQNFDDITLEAKGNFDSVTLSGSARNIYINDSLSVPIAIFNINGRNDSSKVSIYSGASQAVDKANLNALVLTYEDGVRIEVDPSSFVINSKTWTIDDGGSLEFRGNADASGQLVLREGDQEIRMRTVPTARSNRNDMIVELKRVNLGDFSPYLLPHNRLEGLLSGTVKIEDLAGKNLKISSDNIETKFLRLDNDSLGEVKANLLYEGATQELKVNGNTLNQENYLGFNAHLFFGDKEAQKKNLIALTPRNFQLSVLERFLGDLFSDIQGFLTGDFSVQGEFDNLSVYGKGRMKDAGLKINFTQCFYYIEDSDLELKPTEIRLDGLVLKDPVTGNPIYVNGNILHSAFKNMFFDVRVATRKPFSKGDENNRPVQLLNTSYQDNQQFYGNVKGTGSFVLQGPQSEMIMAISAIASTRDSSYITIPPDKSRESGMADFLVERKYGRELSDSSLKAGAGNVIYDLDITANPMVNVKVQLDDLTGDEIKGRGRGTLNIHSGTSEPLRIRGRFDIEEGDYRFTFQSFAKKDFKIKKNGNNFIEWTDDPYDARINFEAVYTADRVSFAPLVNSLPGVDASLSRARGDVYVVATLSEKLFEPAIKFSLEFPASSPAVTDPGLAFTLKQLEENINEINKQVTYLIVFNSFTPVEGGVSTESSAFNISEIATSTISGIFLGVINDQLNKILGKLLKNEKYLVNLNTSVYNRNVIDPNNKTALNLTSNVNFSIGRSFFNDRFIITAGGGFDAPLQQESNVQQSIQLLPDVTMEWLINESGSIRASFFYRENADFLTTNSSGGPGRARRYGGSLSYRKEFNKLSDLFSGGKAARKKAGNPANDDQPPPSAEGNKEEENGRTTKEKENKD